MSPEQGKPQERVARAREVVRHLVKALKIRRLYGAKNVNANGAREQLGRELASYLDVHGTLELEVTRDSFALEGAAVYDEPSQEANLAFGLYLGGVRELTVSQGVQDDELEGLVAILADNRAEDREISSRLWESEFQHIEYVCLDELSEGWEQSDDLSGAARNVVAEMNARSAQIVDSLASPEDSDDASFLTRVKETTAERARRGKLEHDQAIVDDDDDDEDYLVAVPEVLVSSCRKGLQRALASDRLLSGLVEPVIDGLSRAPAEIGAENALWFLGAAPGVALRRDDLKLLADIAERYTTALTAAQGALAGALRGALEQLGSPENIARIVAAATKTGVEPAILCSLLDALDKGGITIAVRVLLGTHEKEMKVALTKLLASNATIAPEELAPLVEPSAPADTARATVEIIVKNLKGPVAERLLDSARKHPSVGEYASHLWRTQTARGRIKAFTDALDSSDIAERIRAAETLGKARDAEALEPLMKLVDDPSFLARSVEEMRAFLAAVAAIGGSRAMGFLQRQTTRSTGIFRLRAGTEIRSHATQILSQLSSSSSDRLKTRPPEEGKP